MSERYYENYTNRRLGTQTPRGKVVICPKCGRRGALGIGWMPHATFSEVYHFSYLQLGFNVWPVEGRCSISLEGPPYPEKIRREREKAVTA